MRIKHLIFITFLILLPASTLTAQIRDVDSPTECEENEARLDRIAYLLSNQDDPSSVLIIIARLGSGENSFEVNRHRLYYASEYLLAPPSSISKDRVITAAGEKTGGFGRVEFYLGGKLVDRIMVRKNGILCVDCCENNRIKPYVSRPAGQALKRKRG